MKRNNMTRAQALRKLNTLDELFRQVRPGDDFIETYDKTRQAAHILRYVFDNGRSFGGAKDANGSPVAGVALAAAQRVKDAMGELVSVAEGREFRPEIISSGRLALQELQGILAE